MQEVGFEPKNVEKPVHCAYQDWDEYNSLMGHEIILASLPCGMTVALDSACIQFGWKEKISSWSAYKEHRVNHITRAKDLSPTTAGSTDDPSIHLLGLMRGANWRNNTELLLMETVVLSLTSQLKSRFGGVKNFLRLKDPGFTLARTAIVAAAKRGLTMLADEINNSAEPRILDPSDSGRRSAAGQKSSEKDIFWFMNRRMNVADERLHRVWKARWDPVIKIEFQAAQTK